MAEQITPFALLRLPEKFALSAESIEQAWRNAIALVHPDRFADRPIAERRVAEQWAGRINEARETLENPVSRAVALLKLRGIDSGSETDTHMDVNFLMEQMSWREEAADAAGDKDKLASVLSKVRTARSREEAVLTEALDQKPDSARARDAVRRLMFIEKMARDLGDSPNK